jgi:hypothetical protein
MTIKTCKGCATQGCLISHNSLKKARVCPCIDCLVKASCLEPCEDFNSLIVLMYPNIETWRKNYKAYSLKKVFFPCGNPNNADGNIRKGYFAIGSIAKDLKEHRPDVTNSFALKPGDCPYNAVYFEDDQIIYINK